jgi:hypothetical protein
LTQDGELRKNTINISNAISEFLVFTRNLLKEMGKFLKNCKDFLWYYTISHCHTMYRIADVTCHSGSLHHSAGHHHEPLKAEGPYVLAANSGGNMITSSTVSKNVTN